MNTTWEPLHAAKDRALIPISSYQLVSCLSEDAGDTSAGRGIYMPAILLPILDF